MTLALLFSPQGSQAVGMGAELAATSRAARDVFDRADAALDWSVSGVAFDGPAERLNDTRQTQPCLLATSIAALRALQERVELAPSFVAGHSVGEYAALVAAGVLELEAALRLVSRRAQLMAAADVGGGMAAIIGLEREAVEEAVAGSARPTELVVANDNAPGQVVISGHVDAIEAAEPSLRAAGAKRIVRLPVSGAFHSPLMAPVAEAMADAFEGEAWRDPSVPVVSNVTAEPIEDAARIRALLAEQVRSPVEWAASVRHMVAGGAETFVECGPGNALTGMVRRIASGVRLGNVADVATLESTTDLLSAAEARA